MREHTQSSFSVKPCGSPPQPTPTDALSRVSRKLLWHECVWASDEKPAIRLFLIAVGRFFDLNGRGSSMSYQQIAREVGVSVRTAKRHVEYLRGRWLAVHTRKGYKHAEGRANLYEAIVPDKWVPAATARIAEALAFNRARLAPQSIDGAKLAPQLWQEADFGTSTGWVDNHLRSNTPPPRQTVQPNSRTPSGSDRNSNSNVIDFASLRWGGRS